MILTPIQLDKAQLQKNYDYWLKKWSKKIKPDKELERLVKDVFTTHTFPYEKFVNGRDIVVYESIFSTKKHNGILSNGFRKTLKINPDDDRSSRNIPEGLENYAFAYLGMHQPYYAKRNDDKIGLFSKPFGVFIKNPSFGSKCEKFPHNHASRRDIGSREAKDITLEFLLPDNARELISYQICNDLDHKVSSNQIDCFWHYYGNLDYWKTEGYADMSWEKKAEFRYFEKLDLSDILAVLWPIWKDGEADKYSRTHDDLPEYERKFPFIKFITYDLDLRDPEISFIEASYIALAFYMENKIFPNNISIAKDILNN